LAEPATWGAGATSSMQQQTALIECPVGTVACLGSSGGRAFDWVGELERRPRNHELDFRNFSVGGDLTFAVVERVPDLIAAAPDKIIVSLGVNDVLVGVLPRARRPSWLATRQADPPTPFSFHENLSTIVRRLKMGTEAQVALCSLSPIGEDPEPAAGLQLALNQRIAEYSAIVAHVARAEHCAYIAVGEALSARIEDEPGPGYQGSGVLPVWRDAFRAQVLRQTPDQIGARNGWRYHTDGVRLNDRAGQIAADLVQRFLEG
jgi:lysophospholipase L1-like esterase